METKSLLKSTRCRDWFTIAFLVAGIALSDTVAYGQSLLLNPSFEKNYNETWPHYGPIDDWTGGSGVNDNTGPFHNPGTPVPDQARVAFIQGSAQLSQEITGLKPGKQYWIQFFYDARNCCGGTIDLVTRFNDVDLDKIANVKAVTGGAPFNVRTVAFTPEADSGKITLATIASGDATVVLDAVTIIERATNNVPVVNPSFEASGTPEDPQGLLTSLAGWAGEGNFGVNASGQGPVANNGTAPDQGMVGYLQGASSITQRIGNLLAGSAYQLSFAYNASTGTSPHLQVKAGATTVADEDVAPVGGTAAYRTKTVSFTATEPFIVISFAQTKAGDHVLLLDDIQIVGQAQEKLPPLQFSPTAAELAPGQKTTVTVTVPARLLASRAVDIKLRSPNQAVARLLNADADGLLTVHYDKGAPETKTFEIEAAGRGVTRLEVVDSSNLDIADDVSVNVVTSLVRNSSFESSPRPGGVGYGPILAWTGGSGLNKADGPFQDNGAVPDRDQVAFIQGSAKLSQEISGLIPGKNYWLQFRYNARNCCGGTIDLAVSFGGKELVAIPKVAAVITTGSEEYSYRSVSFKPAESSGLLEFATTAQGDATLLLDAVSLVQRDENEVVLQNPSFEATGSPVGVGYLQPRKIAGWELTGGYGVNITGVGPFSDNGTALDQDRVLFMQGPGTAKQIITGLTPNRDYTLIYYMNARNCCGGGATRYSVSFAGEAVFEEEVTPSGGTEPYQLRFKVVKSPAAEAELLFTTTPEGDHTFLLDNIRLVPGQVTPENPPPPGATLAVTRGNAGVIRISWPVGTAQFVLQSTAALPAGWANVTEPTVVEGNQNVVNVTAASGARFYRLILSQ